MDAECSCPLIGKVLCVSYGSDVFPVYSDETSRKAVSIQVHWQLPTPLKPMEGYDGGGNSTRLNAYFGF